MTYNPNMDLVFGIFMILVPFIILGALGIAAVIFSKKEGEPSATAKAECVAEPPHPVSGAQDTAEASSSQDTPAGEDILMLATRLEELLKTRINGEPDPQISNGSHDLKLGQELNTWVEWERGFQKSHREQEPS